uniref:hypothetical protein n=1 Tax=Paenibacillus koleovorans TaxID=121608 RepID=UPI0013E387EA
MTLRSEALQYDELAVSIKPLSIYQKPTTERNAEQVRRLLQEGISQGGAAYGQAVYKLAQHFIQECGYTYGAAKRELRQWTWAKCSTSLYDPERADGIISAICYKLCYTCYKGIRPSRSTRLKDGELCDEDLQEIRLVEEKPLRVLYAILYRHGKVFGDRCGRFYMTYQQMMEAGSGRNRSRLKAQVERL